jgi:SAM-dependent methyltransferase
MSDKRKLSQVSPALGEHFIGHYTAILHSLPDPEPRLERTLMQLDQLCDLQEYRDVLVLGCGPEPETIRLLANRGFRVVGIEPVVDAVHMARQYLGSSASVLEGSAEAIDLPSGSQHIIFCESVLEHVDSPIQSLGEMYRVLKPGGIAFIVTTNRHRFSWRGENGEFNVRYYNWLPDIVKESYVFSHLHFKPTLANYSLRPAVHWFSFAELCKLGRYAGFSQFYGSTDLTPMRHRGLERRNAASLKLRDVLLTGIKHNPWMRSLALTQWGGTIFMVKRSE